MKRISAVVGVLVLLALPGSALARHRSCGGYGHAVCASAQPGQSTAAGASRPIAAVERSAPTTAATAPFSGLDVVLLLGGVGALVGAGLLVRHAARWVI